MGRSNKAKQATVFQAPDGWQLWHHPAPESWGWEFLLYSDSAIRGTPYYSSEETLGPWLFFPTGADPDGPRVTAQLAVRSLHAHPLPGWQVDPRVLGPSDPGYKGTADWYTGQSGDDEVASLLSVALGVRLRSGGMIRQFRVGPGEDPAGLPTFHDHRPPVLAHTPIDRMQVSGLFGAEVPLAPGLELLGRYPLLTPTQAVALVKAAKHYADALWIANSDPEQAWLRLVTAIEVVADLEKPDTADPSVLFSVKFEASAELIRAAGGEDLLARVAQEITGVDGATKKFLGFMAKYSPGPPPGERPKDENHQVDWDRLDRAMTQIYTYRSRFLHSGSPFPVSMGMTILDRDDDGVLPECPDRDGSYGTQNSHWGPGSAPMHLWVFAYITREALMSWWREHATSNTVEPPPR